MEKRRRGETRLGSRRRNGRNDKWYENVEEERNDMINAEVRGRGMRNCEDGGVSRGEGGYEEGLEVGR